MEIVGFVVLGVVAGALAATLGIGGGVVFVPVLVAVFSFSQYEAQGTSLAIIVPTALIAATTHARADRIIWRLMVIISAVGVAGAIAGARTALVLDEAILRRCFAVVLAVMAVRMARRAASLRSASAVADRGTHNA